MRVLMAVDVVGTPEGVVDKAAVFAARLGATVDLVYVNEYSATWPYVSDPAVQQVVVHEWARIRDDERARLEALQARLPEVCRGQVLLLEGRATQVIAERAAGYDLVIVGTHGRTGISHLMLGSVAERIVRTCPAPVLVMREV